MIGKKANIEALGVLYGSKNLRRQDRSSITVDIYGDYGHLNIGEISVRLHNLVEKPTKRGDVLLQAYKSASPSMRDELLEELLYEAVEIDSGVFPENYVADLLSKKEN